MGGGGGGGMVRDQIHRKDEPVYKAHMGDLSKK